MATKIDTGGETFETSDNVKESFLRGGRYYTDLYGRARRPSLGRRPGRLDAGLGLVATGNADADADDGSETDQAGDDGIGFHKSIGRLAEGRFDIHLSLLPFFLCLFFRELRL